MMENPPSTFGVFAFWVDSPAISDPYFICVANLHCRMLLQKCPLLLQFLRLPLVIGIQQGNPFSLCAFYAQITGRAHA